MVAAGTISTGRIKVTGDEMLLHGLRSQNNLSGFHPETVTGSRTSATHALMLPTSAGSFLDD